MPGRALRPLNWLAMNRPYDMWALGAALAWAISWLRPGAAFLEVHHGLQLVMPWPWAWGLYFAALACAHILALRFESWRPFVLSVAAATWWGVFGSFVTAASVTGWGMYLLHALGCSYASAHASAARAAPR